MHGQLKYPFSYKWHTAEGVSVIGSAWYDGKLLEGNAFAKLFVNVGSEDSFCSLLLKLNGFFALVLESSTFQAAAVDHIRSFPIVFSEHESGFNILTDYSWKPDYSLNQKAARTFENAWCVQGNDTLIQGISQLSAGQLIWHEKESETSITTYYHHLGKRSANSSREKLARKAEKVFESTFKRTLAALAGRPVLVPLSGGYDSRLLLTMLVKAGYKDLTAYTYGDPNGHEAKIARKVAEKLKVKWHFIEYDEEAFALFFKEDWNTYSNKNHFFTSLPHEQDFFALHHLRSRGLLPHGFVALPGFCGDILGGSVTAYHPSKWTKAHLRKMIAEKILHTDHNDADLTGIEEIHDKTSFYDAFQQWYVSNKESKFIVNAIRVYEYFGGSWMLPFWDRELADFWYSVPYDLREDQSLYNEVLFTEYFTPMGVDFKKPGFDDNYPNKIKEKIKDVLPDPVKSFIQHIKSHDGSDVNRLGILNRLIIEALNEQDASNDREVNRSHARYFLRNLNK